MSNPYITVEDLKSELTIDVTDTDDDSRLEVIADSVWDLWSKMTNRVWETTSYTDYHSPDYGMNRVYLKNIPVEEVVAVYDDVDWVFSTSRLIDQSDYNHDPETGELYYNGYFDKGFRNVKVEYIGGYTTSNFPKSLKQTIIRQGTLWFRQAKEFSDIKKTDFLPDFTYLSTMWKRY